MVGDCSRRVGFGLTAGHDCKGLQESEREEVMDIITLVAIAFGITLSMAVLETQALIREGAQGE